MRPALPDLGQLVDIVRATAPQSELDQVGAAVVTADHLGALGDQLVSHFVQAARDSGCSWSQIGTQLGVSKQAAQQGFMTPTRRRRLGKRRPTLAYERWTDRARQVITLAKEEAFRLRHNYVGTEHLLLGLIAEGQGVGAATLRQLGIDAESVRAQVEEIIGLGMTEPTLLGNPFTPRTKKVMQLAVDEAARLKQDYVGTEHILLGLVREGEGVAALILVKLGADLFRVRSAVLRLLEDGAPGAGGSPGPPG